MDFRKCPHKNVFRRLREIIASGSRRTPESFAVSGRLFESSGL
jgi:hypothetical protein